MTSTTPPDAGGPPRVRAARPEDAEALAELFWQVRRENAGPIPMVVHPRESVLPFLRHVLDSTSVWVAEGDDGPVGFVALGRGGELDHLYVAGAHTGAGLGARLVDLAKAQHPDGLALWVFASNTGAVRFYERHGFVVVGGTDGDNEEGAPDLRMEWRPVSAGGSPR